ncbi:MAG: hypothetical protein AAF197_02830 [Pseudomonadota bacterium]
MKKNLLVVLLTLFLTACSSGTTVAPIPFNLTGLWVGTFENTPGTQMGSVTFNLAQATDTTVVTGNFIFESDIENCLANGVITDGTVTGFSVSISATISSSTADADDTWNLQLTQSNNGSSLDGTYVTTGGNICSNSTGSGTISLTRS